MRVGQRPDLAARMIHVVTAANRHNYRRQLDQMHAARARVFIEYLGWPLPRGAEGGERDEGDDDRAVYLLVLDSGGEVRASCRLRPFDSASLLLGPARALAADLATDDTADAWEIGRILLQPAGVADGGVRGGLRLAAAEEALRRGAQRLVGLAEAATAALLMRSGLAVRPLGPTGPLGRSLACAFEIDTTQPAVEALRARLAVDGVMRVELPRGVTVSPEEVEDFLANAQRLDPLQLRFLLKALRRAADEEN